MELLEPCIRLCKKHGIHLRQGKTSLESMQSVRSENKVNASLRTVNAARREKHLVKLARGIVDTYIEFYILQ